MNFEDIKAATRLTREGRLKEALAALNGRHQPASRSDRPFAGAAATAFRPGLAMPDAGAMLERLAKAGARAVPAPEVPAGASFVEHVFAGAAGGRAYKLYTPSRLHAPSHAGSAPPLMVMLHGCTQSPDDFALGTGMNGLAEEKGFLVAYPAQTAKANPQRCWNWFDPKDQRRETGELAILAGLTREIIARHGVDPRRVYVAGLSAGGAAAANLGAAYPDLFAAIGVHSGLACGAARDLPSALAAMKQGAAAEPLGPGRNLPAIIFHGDRDATVHPANGEAVAGQARRLAENAAGSVSQGRAAGGLPYTRTVYTTPSGRVAAEHWVVHGAGHAWSGGGAAGSYTEPRGPDASREMLRFFLQQAHS